MWFNPIIAWLLNSPLHGLLSPNTMLVTYSGRRSGKTYQVPVNYLRDGNELLTTSLRNRTWWRNLRGGARVRLRLAGQDVLADSQVFETDSEVAEKLERIVRLNPSYAQFLDIHLDAEGKPDQGDLLQAALKRIVVLSSITRSA